VVAVAAAGFAFANRSHIEHFVSRQWHSFLELNAGPGAGTQRLTSLHTSRSDAYRVALDEWKSAPIFGVGSGGFQAGWYRLRRVAESTQNAHSLYLETLAELGLIGALLLAVFIGAIVTAGVRARRMPVALSRSHATTAIAGGTVWLVHAGIDWDWQMPALSGLGLLLLAMLLPAGSVRRRPQANPAGRRRGRVMDSHRRTVVLGGVAAAALAASVYTWIGSAQARRLTDANRLGAAGDFRASLSEAASIGMAPFRSQAELTEAYDYEDLRNYPESTRHFAQAATDDPQNWVIRYGWAGELLAARDRRDAATELSEAIRLNPKLQPALTGRLAALVQARPGRRPRGT
jgi:tetratricopeptide (TPR) repeat protein